MTILRSALASAVVLAGCSAAESPPAAPVSPVGVITWALGVEYRTTPPPAGDTYLARISAKPRETSVTRVTPGFLSATSFLPILGDSRIFFAVDGKLAMQQARSSPVVLLKGGALPHRITRLLAAAPASEQVTIMAAVELGSGAEVPWVVTVDDRSIAEAAPLQDVHPAMSQAELSTHYRSPRCLKDGSDCLQLSADHGEVYIDVESARGEYPRELITLHGEDVRGATWAADDAESLYILLGGCADGARDNRPR